MNTSMIEIKGVTKHYQKFSLGPIDLQVEEGTALAVVGTNGSGKSTFFRMLMNLLQADSGSIQYFGDSMTEKETDIKREIGYAGELLEPFGNYTIKELSSLISYWYPSWDHQYCKLLVERYSIDEEKKFEKCSKGTKKKVEFIFSICHDAKILLLDEPSAGVDIISQRKMKEDLMQYMEAGDKSLILATHNNDEVKQLCDYIAILDQGKIITTFEKDEIYNKWARLWISDLPEALKNHPHVMKVEEAPFQIVTDDVSVMERELEDAGISISHRNRLSIEEVIEFIITRGKI
ncbi:ABC transporter ATP-binding protein [Bacillus sp. PS06]|uniref:ABC transporter ATP-binding protein n=1 Tax=Bacillus sp. PS06 TaxID=2764176 RepID=UPI00177AA153|nr:ABC transporter ATP-binding protein [Bacillus sp. PS06]MBD8069827.1 ABC transporter ATP-binding protein [Bacillus sp. PS06]